MTLLDWALVVVWAGITLGGFFKGAIRIVFSLGGVAAGIWLSVVVGSELAAVLLGSVGSEWIALILAYLIPVAVVTALCLLAGWGMEKTLDKLKLGCVNRVLGAALAGAAAAVVLAVLLVTAIGLSPELARMERQSTLLAHVRTVLGAAGETDGTQEAAPDDQEAAATSESDDAPPDGGSSGR